MKGICISGKQKWRRKCSSSFYKSEWISFVTAGNLAFSDSNEALCLLAISKLEITNAEACLDNQMKTLTILIIGAIPHLPGAMTKILLSKLSDKLKLKTG